MAYDRPTYITIQLKSRDAWAATRSTSYASNRTLSVPEITSELNAWADSYKSKFRIVVQHSFSYSEPVILVSLQSAKKSYGLAVRKVLLGNKDDYNSLMLSTKKEIIMEEFSNRLARMFCGDMSAFGVV